MAAAVPVLVTPGVNLAGSIRQAEAGWTVERDVEPLAEAMRLAMTDEGERRRRGLNGRALSATFRWPAVADSLRALYERVVADYYGVNGRRQVRRAGSAGPESGHAARTR